MICEGAWDGRAAGGAGEGGANKKTVPAESAGICRAFDRDKGGSGSSGTAALR